MEEVDDFVDDIVIGFEIDDDSSLVSEEERYYFKNLTQYIICYII